MTRQKEGWLERRFARLSTGVKMALIMSLALFPLGLIAILASVSSARQNSAERAEETLTRLEIKAQRLNSVLARSAVTIGAANTAIALAPPGSGACQATLRRLETGPWPARYALYQQGNVLRCATRGFTPPPIPADLAGQAMVARITPDARHLRFAVFGVDGRLEGIGEYSLETLSQLTYIPGTSPAFDLELRQGDRVMVLRDEYRKAPFVQKVEGTEPIAGGRLHLHIAVSAPPVTAVEILLTLLPVMMWLAAGLIGWAVAEWLLAKPLVRMQRAVSAYRPGETQLDLPRVATPAREIDALGSAFDQVARSLSRHEADLEVALERQTRLVREVHHRVKNNLQVVASLLSIHSRGAANEEVAAAYASIQRRVDALAVVHRNHYAELEDNRGVALKALISELGANLRATAPPSAAGMAVSLDLETVHANQDVAVSVAFLVTEMVEFAMLCEAQSIAISLSASGPGKARLAIESDSLKEDADCDPQDYERFDRIITGLSRQLRSAMERDLKKGCFTIEIATAVRAEEEAA